MTTKVPTRCRGGRRPDYFLAEQTGESGQSGFGGHSQRQASFFGENIDISMMNV